MSILVQKGKITFFLHNNLVPLGALRFDWV